MTEGQPRRSAVHAGGLAAAAGMALAIACEAPRPEAPVLPGDAVTESASIVKAPGSGIFNPSQPYLRSLVARFHPELLAGRDAPATIVAFVFNASDSVVRETTALRTTYHFTVDDMLALFPDLKGQRPPNLGVAWIAGSMARVPEPPEPGSVWAVWASFRSPSRPGRDLSAFEEHSGTLVSARVFTPSVEMLRGVVKRYHPEVLSHPDHPAVLAFVFDERDSVVRHAVGDRTTGRATCSEALRRLLPEFGRRRFGSEGCAAFAGGQVVVLWGSLRRP